MKAIKIIREHSKSNLELVVFLVDAIHNAHERAEFLIELPAWRPDDVPRHHGYHLGKMFIGKLQIERYRNDGGCCRAGIVDVRHRVRIVHSRNRMLGGIPEEI